MALKIYNTLTQTKEVFKALHPPKVKMYCCGPTVYDLLHIGNFRGAVFYNCLRLYLEHKGFEVTYAYNFTDVDDKILQRAKKENKSMQEISTQYIKEFKKDFKSLKLKNHDHNPQATHYICDMIELIKKLIQNKKAYEVQGDIFYHVPSFSNYGELSKKKGEELISGSRVEIDKRKKDPRDFALWKHCSIDEPGWDSPWGFGRPGWHIECTSMIHSLLKTPIDIHGGGTDLIFPHHENERAQAQTQPKKTTLFVKYWIHNNMFTFGGEKMAKSTGNQTIMRNFLTIYNGEIFKYLVLSSHYRSMIEVSEKKIQQCIQALTRIYSFLHRSKQILKNSEAKTDNNQFSKPQKLIAQKIEKALDDDLNTPNALSILFTQIRHFNDLKNKTSNAPVIAQHALKTQELILKYGKIMSLFQESPDKFLKNLDDIFITQNHLKREEIDQLVNERSLARKNKNFKKADAIRDQLSAMNIQVKDTPNGSVWETNKIFNTK